MAHMAFYENVILENGLGGGISTEQILGICSKTTLSLILTRDHSIEGHDRQKSNFSFCQKNKFACV